MSERRQHASGSYTYGAPVHVPRPWRCVSTHGAKIRREARASRRQTLSQCARAELRLRRPRLGTRGTAAAAAKLTCLQASSHHLTTLQRGRRCTHWRCASCGWTRRRLRSTTWSNGGRVGRAAVHVTFWCRSGRTGTGTHCGAIDHIALHGTTATRVGGRARPPVGRVRRRLAHSGRRRRSAWANILCRR